MEHIKSLYKEAFERNGDSAASVLWPKGRQTDRFSALTKNIRVKKNFSVLDYGCGLAHLKEHIDSHCKDVQYTGVDIVEDFLKHNKEKYKDAVFLHPEELFHNNETYDYILSSGAFNILYVKNKEEHRDIVFGILEKLFEKTNIYLAVNFMTDQVDFQQEGAYHQNAAELFNFCSKKLSRRLMIDQSYMPFEYTIHLFKDDTIIKPDNTFRAL